MMKKIVFLIIVSVIAWGKVFAQTETEEPASELAFSQEKTDEQDDHLSPEELFLTGNEHYIAERFQEAIKTYEIVIEKGSASDKLYYNLGNAYYKTGNIPKAILNFERASVLNPNDDDIAFNIQFCNQFVVDKIEPLPRPFFVQWYQAFININSVDEWAVISLVAFVFALLFALWFVFTSLPAIKKLAFALGILFILICIATGGFALQQKNKILKQQSAIIFTPTVTVKASPDDSGTALFVIHEGLKVDVLESVGNWYKIRLIDGNIGWVKKEVLEMI